MSTLKVNKLRDTAGSADAITLDPNGGAVLAGVTTVTSVKVGAAVTISESGIEASGIGITCANINGTQIGGRRNIIINGDMRIAQRGTSTTTSGGYAADRLNVFHGGTDEAPTFAQADVSSGTTPYTLGFRKCLKVTNGNQTSGAGAADYVWLQYKIEAQDIANSGWNYTSTSSFITLSFWVKSSVAQDFKGFIQTSDGTAQSYPFATGSLTADTWTKVTKTIPGNSNLQFDNDVNTGLNVQFLPFFGTDYTASSATEDAWQAYSSSARCKDSTSTWYTTNDATWEITGIQLEVGSQATPFEHRSFGEELDLCRRYCQVYGSVGNYTRFGTTVSQSSTSIRTIFYLKKQLRAVPSYSYSGNFQCAGATNFNMANMALESSSTGLDIVVIQQGSMSVNANNAFFLAGNDDTSAKITFDSEL